ncbi:MAG: prolipoprotein diacylglyceryl transferase [Myxococcota bacterium]
MFHGALASFLAALTYPDIDPVIFSIGPVALRWYSMAYVVGLLVGISAMKRIARDPRAGFSPKDAEDYLLWCFLGVMVGGRIGYVLFYHPEWIWTQPSRIIAVWRGGLSFHGGFIGVVVATFVFVRKRQRSFLAVGDAVVSVAPIGIFLGRCANFINGELWGRPTEHWIGMVFPNGTPVNGVNVPRHPSQLYEAFGEGLILLALIWILRRTLFGKVAHGFFIGVFLLGYGVARTTAEQFREPDAHLSFLFGTDFITMGALLSTPMWILGVYLTWSGLRGVKTAL